MISQLQSLLEREDTLSSWQIAHSVRYETQLYVTRFKPEAVREVEVETAAVTVHIPHADGKSLGETTFVVQKGDDFASALKKAVERAGFIRNPFYTFPKPEEKEEENGAGNADLSESHDTLLEKIAEDMEHVHALEGVVLSYYEVFLTKERKQVINACGLSVSEDLDEIFVEYVLLSEDEEREAYHSCRSRSYETLSLCSALVQTASLLTCAGGGYPPTGCFSVLFCHDSLDTLFDFFIGQTKASSLFAGWSRYREGEEVVPGCRGDKLFIQSDPTLKGLMGTSRYDADGLKRRKVTLIEGNRYKGVSASSRHAQLIGVPATGSCGNIVVASGEKSVQQLLEGGNVLEVHQFSTFLPNPVTGAFSGEIRIGYWHDAEGNKRAVKGGSVSGMMLDAFASAYFSKERVVRERYAGPEAVLLRSLQLSGE